MANTDLHILFFPLMAQGHMIPILDIAKLFSNRGVKATIITTPLNAPLFSNSAAISLRVLEFPAKQAGLPDGFENLAMATEPHHHPKFFHAISLLRQPLDDILAELRPHALVADAFFTWATDLAAKHDIPGIVFHGTSFISMCCIHSLSSYKPYESVASDDEQFVLPGLPDRFELTRMQIPENLRLGITNDFTKMINEATAGTVRSYGMIVNSFYELEPAYADHYRKVLGRKAWHIGPVSLCNRDNEAKARRGKAAAIDEHECLRWLDSKGPGSVVYMCFGTNVSFSALQLREIAMGLEASGQDFVWVVRKGNDKESRDEGEEWLPEGFEERTKGKGLIIRGWAPQVLILDHKAVGLFVTHCGWNSVLEGVSAGLPMVTWPIFAEQFYNEKLIVEVVKTGVGVGARKWVRLVGDYVESEKVARAVKEVIAGERSEEIRAQAKALGEMARRAVEEGGSSFSDLGNLIQELKARLN